jgi:tetratricopeptide (TPR) repeat protein
MRARICTLRGNLCFPLGRLDACLQAHRQAHDFAARASSPADIARALGGLGDAYYQRGRMLTAREHFAQCIRQAREHDLVGVLLANLPMLAITHTNCGDPAAAHENVREAIELARRIGDLRGELLAHLTMASGLLVQGQVDECRTRARQALELARQLDARRFQAECLGIIAATMPESERDEALRLAEEALQLAQETAMSYCGPVLLSIVARLTANPARRAEALAAGESLLAGGCVSHSYFEFYGNAIEVSLRDGAWQDARRYADGLETYTSEEPLPLSTLLIRRARLLADVGEGHAGAATRAALHSLQLECRRMNTLLVLPAIEAAAGRIPC